MVDETKVRLALETLLQSLGFVVTSLSFRHDRDRWAEKNVLRVSLESELAYHKTKEEKEYTKTLGKEKWQ